MLDIIGAIFALGFMAVFCYFFMLIFKKAGFNKWYGILVIIPLINILIIAYLALAEWPIAKTNEK